MREIGDRTPRDAEGSRPNLPTSPRGDREASDGEDNPLAADTPHTPPPEIPPSPPHSPPPETPPNHPPLEPQPDEAGHDQQRPPSPQQIPVPERDIAAARRHQHRPGPTIRRKTAATLKVATWNMRGRGHAPDNKWMHINQIMKDQRIGALCLQETHLDAEAVHSLTRIFGRRLHIIHSEPENNPTGSQGVAIVLNRDITNTEGITSHEIIPGRALLTTIPWHDTLKLTILTVYAPNDPRHNAHFWDQIYADLMIQNLPIPDIMLGDFNTVEDPIDRFPTRPDPPAPVSALATLRVRLNLIDGWRSENPTETHYTYLQDATGSRSRLDRIYTTQAIIDTAQQWLITAPPIPSDHDIVSVTVVDAKAPYIGKGRWSIPHFLTEQSDFVAETQRHGRLFLQQCDELNERTEDHNIQHLWQTFKTNVTKDARARAKTEGSKLEGKIANLHKQLQDLPKTAPDPTNLHIDQAIAAAELRTKLIALQRLKHGKLRAANAAREAADGERVTKYWMRRGKTTTPRDIVYALKSPRIGNHPPNEATRSDTMANLTKDYYNHIQDVDPILDHAQREQATTTALNALDSPLPDHQQHLLDDEITIIETIHALTASASGKASGLDGIPYELWKALHRLHWKAQEGEDTFNITDALTRLYNDIQTHGITPGTPFAHGWIWQKHKKGSKQEVQNYRPITLLNTDYKIFTKILAMRLAKIAPNLIHPDQAGFVPSRSIFDHIRLAKLMTEYAEATEENGLLVALDQEKAYDRIAHDYLWQVLRKYNLPETFIALIQNLYTNAESLAIVNGVPSNRFHITRGVRQGDPMSCLLFDLAIEPLACMLRQSTLQGYDIPHAPRKLITTLFADDTAVYLSEHDSYTTLQTILDTWCLAARAKFNITKTQAIPLGTPDYRHHLLQTRQLHPADQPLHANITLIPDGATIRYLGARVGNTPNPDEPWMPTIENISTDLQTWNLINPTMEGRRLAVNTTVGGRTQFLTKAQSMPKHIETLLVKINLAPTSRQDPLPIFVVDEPIVAAVREVLAILAVQCHRTNFLSYVYRCVYTEELL